MNNLVLLSGSANRPLAQKIAKHLKRPLGNVLIQHFSDGETYIDVRADLKNKQVFIIQSGSYPANEHLMELLLLIDAAWRLKPSKIVVVFPFMPYRRQDRQTVKGEAVSGQLVADLLETAGADKVIILDMHTREMLSYFDIPVAHISATPMIAEYFLNFINKKDWVLVAPDEGSLWHTENAASVFQIPLIQIIKKRTKHDKAEAVAIEGRVQNRNVILMDDEVDTAGTLIEAVNLLKRQGAGDIYFGGTHAVLSGPAIDRLRHAPIKEIVFTDSIFLPKEKRLKNIKIISVAKLLADAILFESRIE